MKSNAAIETALKGENAVMALPEVVVDWNMNRYIGAVASNASTVEEFETEYFPIESIIESDRPTKGINKARVGSSTIGDDYKIGGEATPNGRFYVAEPDDIYKYWTSPNASDPTTGALTECKPTALYAATTAVNKIVITLENTWASPATFNIQTTTVAAPVEADWTTIATQATTPTGWKGRGQIVLYWNGTNWLNTNRAATAVTTNVRGVRMVVTALEGGYKVTADGSAVASTYAEYVSGVYTTKNTDGKDARFDLIEISARLEVDISDDVINIEDASDLADASQLYPIGTLTSNQATLSLSNLYLSNGVWVPGRYSKDNTASPYHNYIDANAEVNVRYKYYDDNDVYLGTVQHFKMYTEVWSGQSTETVSVTLSDKAKVLDNINVRAAMWEKLTVPELVWRIMDSVGFTNYKIDTGADFVTEHIVPVFYVNGETSVWEVLNELAKASQTAIYFDSYGVMQVKTRDYAFSPADAPVWTFDSEDTTKLADIVSLDRATEYQPNHYKVMYQKTNWSDVNSAGQPTLQQVWEPEDTVTLRASALVRNMTETDEYFWLFPKDAITWPFEGIVNIDGEVIRYKGKEFVYYTGDTGTVKNTVILESFDESEKRNKDTPVPYRHKNHYTGAFKITERGVWDSSEPAAHTITPQNYSVRGRVNDNNKTSLPGLRHIKETSRVLLNPPKAFKNGNDVLVATIGDTDDNAFYHIGTTMKFVKENGEVTQRAGITFNNSGAGEGDGYFVELTPSKRLGGKERKERQELIIYSRTGNKDKRLGGKGQALAVGENIDYELDIFFSINANGSHKIRVWFNGKEAMSVTATGAERQSGNGRFGMFARGRTKVEYEYLYAIRNSPTDEPSDDFSFMDKLKGNYSGQQWKKNWVHGWKDNPRKKKKKPKDARRRLNQYFVDEFGPYVHELREFDVKFDPAPVLHSRIYNTNDWSSAILEYNADPFGAKFIIANTSRKNAVLNGDDSLSFAGTEDSVDQMLTVFGRGLVVEEAEEVIAKNDDQIRRRGKIESELTSTWIQSKAMANDLSDWLNDTFSYGNEKITLEVFGNPLVEIADVVHVNYPDKHINDDFFVIGLQNSFSNGLSTTVDLIRRVRTA